MAKPRAAVIGAGIIGASIAYHLARRGASVAVLDRGRPAGAVTGHSFVMHSGVTLASAIALLRWRFWTTCRSSYWDPFRSARFA